MPLLIPALLALPSLALLVQQAGGRLSLSRPAVVYPAIALFPLWLLYTLWALVQMAGQLWAGGLWALLPVAGQLLLHLFPLAFFLTVFIRINFFPGGADPVRRLGRYAAAMAAWFQVISLAVVIAGVKLSSPFAQLLVGVLQKTGLLVLLLFLVLPLFALPLCVAGGIVSAIAFAVCIVCGTLCTAAAAACLNAAVRLDRRAGKIKVRHILLALLPVVNFILLLRLLRQTVPQRGAV